MSPSLSSARFHPLEGVALPEWRALASSVAVKLERLGCTTETRDGPDRESRILEIVAAGGRRGVSQAEIAAALKASPSCVTRLIDRLEKRGLIDRRQHPTDRRINTVHVTSAGAASAEKARQRLEGAREAALARMSVTELSTLDALLARIGNT